MTSKVIKTYEKLPQDAIDIRNKVFVEEQGFENEFDDMDSSSEHIVIYEKNCSEEKENDMKPIATCRFFLDTDGSYLIGRIAVIKEKRGENIGAFLIETAEKQIEKLGGKQFKIHAQCRVRGFYEKQGYIASDVFDEDEGIPHIWMYKELK